MRWRFLILFILAASLAGALAAMQSLHIYWRAGYTGLGQVNPTAELFGQHVALIAGELRTIFFASGEPGLPPVRIYIGAQERKKLMEDLPSNVKDWQKSYRVYPDGDLKRIKSRHRGDNPANWLAEKKSWRLKLNKKHLLERTRTFIYPVSQEANFIDNHLAYDIARSAGILSPKSRLIELIINEKSQGIYAEIEDIDESFLRNNKIMPVNIYKGEQYNSERIIYTSNYLFNNPSLWEKEAVFNRQVETNKDDLADFFDNLLRARTSDSAFKKLTQVARYDDWARFAAFQVLVHSWHNSSVHNQRLVLDPWRGTVAPVVHDTGMGVPREPFTLNTVFDSSSVLNFYSHIPSFLNQKYRTLWSFIDGGILSTSADAIEAMIPQLSATYSRDAYALESALFQGEDLSSANRDGMIIRWENLAQRMREWEAFLGESLATAPNLTWHIAEDAFSVTVDGPLPSGALALKLSLNAPIPQKIVWDQDQDGRISNSDLAMPFTRVGNTLWIDATLFSNRLIRAPGDANYDISAGSIEMAPTTFSFVADVPLAPTTVMVTNIFTGETHDVPASELNGVFPRHRNIPLLKEKRLEPEIWAGQIDIQETRIIRHPVSIRPGTEIRITAGKSLIFMHNVVAIGTEDLPIIIKPATPDAVWGAFALKGSAASGSKLIHFKINGGSEAVVDGVYYSGMVNIHEGSDHELRHFKASKNLKSDDLIHIVYAKGVLLKGCTLTDALSDAIDVDMSEVIIRDCLIEAAGNDAIDFMSSQALVVNSHLNQSGDKGISVGENSNVLVDNVTITDNIIGIEVKDGSRAYVNNSTFSHNKNQMNGYWKNWRYDGGGHMLVVESKFEGAGSLASVQDQSSIAILNSKLPSQRHNMGKNIFIDPSAEEWTQAEPLAQMWRDFPAVLARWKIIPTNQAAVK
jgi:hypothetical protein